MVGGSAGTNDFDRTNDASGAAWPYHSHTAKMNPRDGRNDHRRMVRRGITYVDGTEKGLLFQSFQSTLATFELLLRWWAGDPDHPHQGGGIDQVLSAPNNPLTTIRGGEYFYFPSIAGLRKITG